MDPFSENIRLVKRAYWLINLRWIATVAVAGCTYFSSNVLAIELHDFPLYCIAALLAVYNTAVLLLLHRLTRHNPHVTSSTVKKIVDLQISIDLLILTFLLHFSGGVENPFAFYFVFHMIIASILLSVKESYLQATLAVLFFGLLILLEYLQVIPHYCLKGFVVRCLHKDGPYVFGTYFVFVTVLYLTVYMTSYIAIRLKQTEQARRLANVQLREKDRIKDEYVLRVTHDIKGHLAAIQSCLDVVNNRLVGPLGNQQADFVGRACNRTRNLTHFVRELLKLTQMRLDNRVEMGMFSLKDSIQRTIAAVEVKAKEKSIILNCKIEPAVDKIFGNKFSIEEMITNLLFNAIRYTPANGTVEITAKNGAEDILVEVSDTGIGIPQDELPKIFDEFYRASNAKAAEKDGTGLGLSIVKQIVENHSGRIWAQSQQGQGTKFSLTLPKAIPS